MNIVMRYRGLLAVLVVLALQYPAFLFGQHMGDMVSELPQEFSEHPIRMLLGLAFDVLIVGVVTWATCIRKRTSDQ